MTSPFLAPVAPRPYPLGAKILFCFAVGGCSAMGAHPQRLEDGTLSLTCDGSLSDCVRRAEEHCGAARIELLGGRLRDGSVGHGGGATSTPTVAEVRFLCASGHAVDPGRLLRRPRPPTTPTTTPPAAAPSTAATPALARVCDPGATQRCVGPGACNGGQSCLRDGSGFGPCDCKTPAAATTAATPTPSASTSSRP